MSIAIQLLGSGPPLSFQRCSDQPFMSNCAVVSFDIGVLLRLAGLDVLDVDAHIFRPCHQLATDVFRAIIDPDCRQLPAPFDDPVQGANAATIRQLIRHKIHRPRVIGRIHYRQCIRLIPFQPFLGPDPQVHLQFTVNLVDPLMVSSAIAFNSEIIEASIPPNFARHL